METDDEKREQLITESVDIFNHPTGNGTRSNITATLSNLEEAIPSTGYAYSEAQAHVSYNLPVSVILRRQLNVIDSFENEHPYYKDCIKIGIKLVFTDYTFERLVLCNDDCSNVQHIPLPYKPWFITKIDHTTVAVSCSNRHIPIIDIDTGTVTSIIVISGHSEGISYNENNLYVFIDLSEVQVMDLTGKVTRTIPLPSYSTYYIIVINDKLICIDSTSIYCCYLEGKQIWKFEERKYKDLTGLTTDGEGNVYVTDEITNTVLVVSYDGKNSIEVLTESNGLNRPIGIQFDKKENILLVNYRFKGTVVLFDVKVKHTEHE
ncbi:Hypothetical predicted protein [Mytilus galloprovincialis]|uniref:Uncharacterized protein n=1 Tax=Mytilus galloprovincialis TaxID=29158 RepID=A0A8B6HJA6_MYTGA|nr:Hypothetical predicted protein [Mytilus galloprovincialis]